MCRVGVSSASRSSAEAGARVADLGGNAVDAALAAAIVSAITQPGICSLGSGAFLTVWPPGSAPVTVDGGAEMPGRGLCPDRFGRGIWKVRIEYAGGVETWVGPGSVATPGALAACAAASERWGRLPWRTLLDPALEVARRGFPLPPASHRYLVHSHDAIFGWDPRSRAVLHHPDGRLKEVGETIRIPFLAETLEALAREGPPLLYHGSLGRGICQHVQENEGLLTLRDLAAYRTMPRAALQVELDEWTVATNPAPAIGGLVLASLLSLMAGRPRGTWAADDLVRLLRAQEAVFRYRRRKLDRTEERETAGAELLRWAAEQDTTFHGSGSTLHTSAVDSDGLACAITLSDGYGSGVMPPGTGMWLNNSLGEPELNRAGLHAWTPGVRLPSNMAPTVMRHPDGRVLALGSPGADRIPTAILFTLLSFARCGLSLEEAVRHPRLHLELRESASEAGDPREEARIVSEPGLPLEKPPYPLRELDGLSMYFGGCQAALRHADGRLELAADPRREGGVAEGGR